MHTESAAADSLALPEIDGPLAVLASGGLDSAILVGEALRAGRTVQPLYVRSGLFWETVELEHLRRYLDALSGPNLRPLYILELPVADLFPAHWSVTGRDVPDADTPDEAVFLPGRNVLLLAKAILWCHSHHVPAVAMAPLANNPFPDATPEFFRAYESIVNQAMGGSVRVLRPYARLRKIEVMRRGAGLPLGLTFSCIGPAGKLHCGRCNKCGERRRAFSEAGLADPTAYAVD
jgi:7-cyano-7-deazaguanine synthase